MLPSTYPILALTPRYYGLINSHARNLLAQPRTFARLMATMSAFTAMHGGGQSAIGGGGKDPRKPQGSDPPITHSKDLDLETKARTYDAKQVATRFARVLTATTYGGLATAMHRCES